MADQNFYQLVETLTAYRGALRSSVHQLKQTLRNAPAAPPTDKRVAGSLQACATDIVGLTEDLQIELAAFKKRLAGSSAS